MSLDDLVQLLTKEAVIYTYRPDALRRSPADVEQRYRVHAGTHVPLGETERYVDTIIRWVGGANKGAFIGAVIGDYGQGKTSFLVHVWASCAERQVLAVPPFTLEPEGIRSTSTIIEHIMSAVDGWVQYRLQDAYPTHAARAAAVYEQFRARTMEEAASRIAREQGMPYEQVLALLISGEVQARTEVSVKNLYDYLEALSQVVEDTGAYRGLLVLLDEPEVAAKSLTTNEVAGFLFDLADTAGQRDGNYGFFMAIAANFYATAESSFSSLTARLQRCGCRVVLDNLYGVDFARVLWERYCERLKITEHSDRIVLPITLEAIGQLGSSARLDLGEGPRTVVSAFARMVARFREQNQPYHPAEFATDCLAGEVYVKAEYATRVNAVFSMPEVRAADERLRLTLAAFPNGVSAARLAEAGLAPDDVLTFQNTAHAYVYRIGDIVGFETLRSEVGRRARDLLREMITTAVGDYAPRPGTFQRACKALAGSVVPMLFTPRQGQQLIGWDYANSAWRRLSGPERTTPHGESRGPSQPSAVLTEGGPPPGSVDCRELRGAFPLTADQFPLRTVVVALSDATVDSARVVAGLPQQDDRLIDAVVHIRLNWNGPSTPDDKRLVLDVGHPQEGKPALVALTVDINHDPLPDEALEQFVPTAQQRPMLQLYLLEWMDRQSLPHQEEAAWKALRDRLVRRLTTAVFGSPELAALAGARLGVPVPAGMDMLPEILRTIFQRRYPDYVTVIKTPRWRDKLDEYVKLLSDTRIPLAVRRGLEPWTVSDEYAAQIFGINKMNLLSAFAGFESLISIESKGRGKGAEIRFHVHPLEKEIRHRVEQSPLKRLFNGHHCPWMSLYDGFIMEIFASGYLLDEIRALVDVGRQRGSFSVERVGRSLVIYCIPLDIPDMQKSLKGRLEEVRALDRELASLGAPSISQTLDELERQIDGLKDEFEYDRLSRGIDEEHQRVRRNITEFCQRLEQRITAAANRASETRQALEGAGAAGLMREVSGRTAWVGELDRVRVYLVTALQEARSRLTAALGMVEPARSAARDLPEAPVRQRLERLREAVIKVGDLETTVTDAEKKRTELHRHVLNFSAWRQLLAMSDAVHDAISRLENEPVHRERSAALRARYDSISDKISNLLKTRHVHALETGEQWKQQIDDLDQEIKDYQKGLRDRFIAVKIRTNQLLKEIGLGDVLLRQGFDEAEVDASYQRLYQEAEARLREAIQREEEGLQKQRIEVLYHRDVLGRLEHGEGMALQSKLEGALEKLAEASKGAVAAEIAAAVGGLTEWPQGGLAEIGGQWVAVQNALAAAREAQRRVRLPPISDQPPESEAARKLAALLADGGVRDLKDLVLGMVREGSDASIVLDTSLKALEELFRLGQVDIRVQRTLRR